MNDNYIVKLLNHYKKLRNASDALMIRKDFDVKVSVFRRDRREDPVWSLSNKTTGIEFRVIDAALIAGIAVSAIVLPLMFSCLFHKFRYVKRW